MHKQLTVVEAAEIRRIYCRTRCGKPTSVCVECHLGDNRAGTYLLKTIADTAIEYMETRRTT